MKRNPKYPLKHVSIRVPWHDDGWKGTICKNPKANNSCLILKNCALNRDDELETEYAGQNIEHLPQDQFPCCVGERGVFMSKFAITTMESHPYKRINHALYGHFKETPLRHAPYSASAIPFLWMQRDEAKQLAEHYDLHLDLSHEPELGFKTAWLQEYSNQKTMLDCFFEHLEIDNSLCFIYAKDVPFVETSGRVLIGVGRVKYVGDGIEYEYEAKGALRSMMWQHQIQHSIRQDFKDGFLLPYYEALEYVKKDQNFNPADLAVLTPSDKMKEFSYATEHVSHDSAIRTLLDCVKSLEIADELQLGDRNWQEQIRWVQERINELEKLRGLYPGLGSALCAFGVERGHFIAREIIEKVGDANPWDLVDELFRQPNKVVSEPLAKFITPMLKKRWEVHKKDRHSKKIDLLQLISRFDITIDQAKAIYVEEERVKYSIRLSDKDMLGNPYLIYECSEKLDEPISFWTIDLGMFPKRTANEILLPNSVSVDDPLDMRRIRALTILQLSNASEQGHTLLSRKELVQKIRELPLSPVCPVAGDMYDIGEEIFIDSIEKVEFKDGTPGYQLSKLYKMGQLIEDTVLKRKSGKRHALSIDWRAILDKEFGDIPDDEDCQTEVLAREEKAATLKEVAEARLSVLVGSAGTGKTTLLSILCGREEINKDGILFLAPTGKARVRMQDTAKKLGIKAYTLAQFLGQYKRYDAKTAQYELMEYERCSQYGTVIVDESSMLTEEMLAALFDSLKGVKRYILVGDFRQLPPIGSGRPFVDIVKYLQPDNIDSIFPRVSPSYAELTVTRRQKVENDKALERQDMTLAKWFSGNPLDSGDDLIFQDLMLNRFSNNLKVVLWQDDSDLEAKLKETLVEELTLQGIDDLEGFNKSLGSSDGRFFNDTNKAKYFKQRPSVDKLDDWQILSPVRGSEHGTSSINRLIHTLFRKNTIEEAKGIKSKYPPKIPRPLGVEEIVYGDKVINIVNHKVYKNRVFPQGGLNYIANGEMGYVIGQFKGKTDKYKGQPQYTEVEFSSQKGYKYTLYQSDFKDEGEAKLELAYAITIHKSQGSEFGLTIVVIPNPCFNLSRELLYTALTRQKDRVVILYQGESMVDLKKYTSPIYSETYSRLTNLFIKPSIREINGRYLEEYLIHCASDNTLLRSKSELIIYEKLLAKGLAPIYEMELTFNGVKRIPDFTIIDDDSGETYYWEHCGMLTKPSYKMRWEQKKHWYFENGILPLEEGGGPNGSLIVTEDSPNEGLSIPEIERIIACITR